MGEDSNATGVGGDQADNTADYAGAAYLFQIETAECFLLIGDTGFWASLDEVRGQLPTTDVLARRLPAHA